MYCVIYSFNVKKGKEDNFKTSWKNLTELIYKYEGSLGSRLHKNAKNEYIAYAQWPSEDVFNNAGGNLPEEANPIRKIMRESCNSIDTLYKMNMIDDLTADNIFNNGK